MSDGNASFVVTRKTMSAPQRAVAAGVAIILVLAIMWFLGPGAVRVEGVTRVGFIFVMGLLMVGFGGGLLLDLIRGRETVLEVNATGMRIKGMPLLSWSEIESVRTEEIVPFNGLQTKSDTSVGVSGFEIELGKGGVRPLEDAVSEGEAGIRRRLGVVPRDPSLIPGRGPFSFFGEYVERKNRETAAMIGRTPIERAPFGLFESEMDAPLEEVAAEIRRYHEVEELSDVKPRTRS